MLWEWIIAFMGNLILLVAGWLGLGFFKSQTGLLGVEGVVTFDLRTCFCIFGLAGISATAIILCEMALNYKLRQALKRLEKKVGVSCFSGVPVSENRIRARCRSLCIEKNLSFYNGAILVGSIENGKILNDKDTLQAYQFFREEIPKLEIIEGGAITLDERP